MKKCVCISCFDHYPTRIQIIHEYLSKKDYDVSYLYASFDHFSKQMNNNKRPNGIKIPVTNYEKSMSIQRILSHLKFSRGVLKYVKENEPDLIYCMFPPNSLVKFLAKYKKKNNNVKLIFDCYDMWPESFPYGKHYELLRLPFLIWGKLRKKYIGFSDLILTVSEQGRAELEPEAHGTRIGILRPVLIHEKLPIYRYLEDTISFVYLGMVNHIIDTNLIVEFLKNIAEYKTTVLHIIGEGQNLDVFVKQLESNNVRVICHGIVFDMEEKNTIFSNCNMGINMPKDEINSTMPLKSVEYLRAGLPIVNSAYGDIRDIIEMNNVGINIDREDLTEGINQVLGLSCEKMLNQHNNALKVYKDLFYNQNLEEILNGVI